MNLMSEAEVNRLFIHLLSRAPDSYRRVRKTGSFRLPVR